ncbi:antigen-presenting glycoprotein CD1d-like isoform X2 [Sceloporus undulatus]|nr:antigen-presenting glycoprotein CD1d-like isoform X2 [Sceloporus undulatus]
MEANAFLGDMETHSLDSQKIRFLQPWASSAFTPQEWDMLEKIINAYLIGFKKTINDMAKTFNASYPLVIQSLIFCEIESNGTTRGFYNGAANGEVMVVLDADNAAWVAQKKDKLTLSVQAYLNKDKGTISTLRSLLSNQCIKALKSFLQAGKASLDRQEVPDAVVFAQESPDSLLLVCRVTGFYPRLVNVSWLQDEKALPSSAVNSTGILPNHDLTYQTRSSLTIKSADIAHSYACRVEHSSLDKRSLVIPWKRKSGVAVPVIIGILVPLLIAVSAVIFYWWRKRRHYEGINQA